MDAILSSFCFTKESLAENSSYFHRLPSGLSPGSDSGFGIEQLNVMAIRFLCITVFRACFRRFSFRYTERVKGAALIDWAVRWG